MLDGSSLFWRRLFILFFIAMTIWRFVYLLWLCPLDLAQDEAHYWEWSRHLDWSYYSKGPLVAWLIRGSSELFGPLSLWFTGSEMAAVRLPAVLCGSSLLLALYILTLQTLRSDRAAFFVALFTSTMPIFTAVSVLITIDSPFVCCWAWALVAGHRAWNRNELWAWFITGLLIGVGILAKYTMSLWLFSFCLFLKFTPGYRYILFERGFWVMAVTAALCSLPILGWNATHGWVSFRHVAGQAGVTGEAKPGVPGIGLLQFVGGQALLLMGWWFAFWVGALIRFRPTCEPDTSLRYLWWMSLPTVVVFGASSLRNAGQVNWPVAAYLSGSVLIAAWLHKEFQSERRGWRRWLKWNVAIACAAGVMTTAIALNSSMIREPMYDLARRLKPNDVFAARAFDPTCRLRGWSELGHRVDAVRAQVRAEEGREPALAALYWNVPGEIGFYCDGHPTVYSLGPLIGERFNQYDLWRPNPIADAAQFRGRTFIVVNGHKETLDLAFEEAVLADDFIYREKEIPVAGWNVWICRGYRGGDANPLVKRDGY